MAEAISQLEGRKLAAENEIRAGDCRESAQSMARRQADQHARELAGWRWIDAAMEVHKPTAEEEQALWSLLSRARAQRY